jgi:hypothetical protein
VTAGFAGAELVTGLLGYPADGVVPGLLADGVVAGLLADGVVAGLLADGVVAGLLADGVVAGLLADGVVCGFDGCGVVAGGLTSGPPGVASTGLVAPGVVAGDGTGPGFRSSANATADSPPTARMAAVPTVRVRPRVEKRIGTLLLSRRLLPCQGSRRLAREKVGGSVVI